jgi:hypothetical protein
MMWPSIREWLMKSVQSSKTPVRRRKVLALEQLEGRLTPSTLHITTQPSSPAVQPVNSQNSHTDTVSFTSTAIGGTGTITIQWQMYSTTDKRFENITGNASASTDTLTVVVPSTAETEVFRAVFTEKKNGKVTGMVTSRVADLTTEVPPGTPTNPQNQTVASGARVTFTATDPAGTALHVQWQVSTDGGQHFTNIMGATRDTYSFMATVLADQNQYRAVFSNALGTATTSAATLTVDGRPVVTVQPHSQVVAINDQVTLTAAAKGSPNQSVQWQVSTDGGKTWNNAAGNSTTNTYTFTAPSTHTVVEYRAVFTTGTQATGFKSTTSRVAIVASDVPPTKQTDPQNLTVKAGKRATFTATVTGTAPMKVVWQVSTDQGQHWKTITGAMVMTRTSASGTTSTLSFMARTGENGDEYRAVFTNALGSADAYTTAAATLSVTA